MISQHLQEILTLFHGTTNITWIKALYDYNDKRGSYLGLIEIWTYFDRSYEGLTKDKAENCKERLINAYETHDVHEFLNLLQTLPSELINNGISQTLSGFEREHDEIDLSYAELLALDDELHRLHSAVLDGTISLDSMVY